MIHNFIYFFIPLHRVVLPNIATIFSSPHVGIASILRSYDTVFNLGHPD